MQERRVMVDYSRQEKEFTTDLYGFRAQGRATDGHVDWCKEKSKKGSK